VQGPKDQGHIVKRYVDGFYELGTVRFHVLLSFQLDFQLKMLVLALKMGILDRDAGFLLPRNVGGVSPC
jgi:hypothetical protein